MNAIYILLERFDSYAVIATHSSIVVREIQSDNVFIVERLGSGCMFRKIAIESLGGDLAELNREVFGADEDQLYHKRKIALLKELGHSVEEIKRSLISDEVPLGIGLNFYIANCGKNEKN